MRLRRWTGNALRLVSAGVVAACLVGQIVRDRTLPTALLFYLPPLVMGAGVILIDLMLLGRTIRRWRFAGTLLGLLLCGIQLAEFLRWGPPPDGPVAGEIRLVQWNVMWGGDLTRAGERNWPAMIEDLPKLGADVMVLSETPFGDGPSRLRRALGEGWYLYEMGGAEPNGYLYRFAILSRWPITELGRERCAIGATLAVRIDLPDGPLRLMVCDGMSRPWRLPREVFPMFMEALGRCAAAGEPIDIVLGDFNTPGRSVGFDAMLSPPWNFSEASDAVRGWRATWADFLPLWRIDHVLVGPGWRVQGCEILRHFSSDHRGHLVRLRRAGGSAAVAAQGGLNE